LILRSVLLKGKLELPGPGNRIPIWTLLLGAWRSEIPWKV
jgi:hypothetical protein